MGFAVPYVNKRLCRDQSSNFEIENGPMKRQRPGTGGRKRTAREYGEDLGGTGYVEGSRKARGVARVKKELPTTAKRGPVPHRSGVLGAPKKSLGLQISAQAS